MMCNLQKKKLICYIVEVENEYKTLASPYADYNHLTLKRKEKLTC